MLNSTEYAFAKAYLRDSQPQVDVTLKRTQLQYFIKIKYHCSA